MRAGSAGAGGVGAAAWLARHAGRVRYLASAGRWGGRRPVVVLGIILVLSGAGCYERVVHDSWAQYRQQLRGWSEQGAAEDEVGAQAAGDAAAARRPQWTILVQTFKGGRAKRDAAATMTRLRDQFQVPDLWIQEGDEVAHLLRGRYGGRGSELAAGDLAQTRLIQLDGQRPFHAAELVPVATLAGAGSLDVRQFAGVWPYTLQVAVFEKETPTATRKAAEDHALRLRKEGHEAYYYHGEQRSMVTVGLFSDEDRVTVSTPLGEGAEAHQYAYGPRIRALQRTFPHNLVNGEPYLVEFPDGTRHPQPSSLVPIR